MFEFPTHLNGYPVIRARNHMNVVTVMVFREEHFDPYVVATWWPELKTTWMWGHYHANEHEAHESFERVAARNSDR